MPLMTPTCRCADRRSKGTAAPESALGARQVAGHSSMTVNLAAVSEDEKWRPRSLPSPLEQARLEGLDRGSGELRLRNGSNMFWGYIAAWTLFGLAALFWNRSILAEPGRESRTELTVSIFCLFLASVLALCVLGRPYVTVRSGVVFGRNPIRTYRFHLADVKSLTSGFWGFPKFVVADRSIRLMGMEESTLDSMRGGSQAMAVLQAEFAGMEPDRGHARDVGIHARWALMDRGLALLLAGWTFYAASFFII